MLFPANFQASTVSGARRSASSAWLAEETHFLEIIPLVTVQKGPASAWLAEETDFLEIIPPVTV